MEALLAQLSPMSWNNRHLLCAWLEDHRASLQATLEVCEDHAVGHPFMQVICQQIHQQILATLQLDTTVALLIPAEGNFVMVNPEFALPFVIANDLDTSDDENDATLQES